MFVKTAVQEKVEKRINFQTIRKQEIDTILKFQNTKVMSKSMAAKVTKAKC